MKTFLVILLIIVGVPVALFCLYVLYAFVRIGYRYYTDDEYRAAFDAKAAEKKAHEAEMHQQKKLNKSGSGVHWLSYPSPLNSWGLWN